MPQTRRETSPVLFAVAGATLMMAHQVGAKSVRDSLFLSTFGPSHLPLMVIAASVFSLVLVFPASWATTQFTPGRLIPGLFACSGVFYGVAWVYADSRPEAVAVVLFLGVVGTGSLLTSGFWALISETLDPYSVKKAIGKIGAGGSLGVAFGGLLTERVGALTSATTMLLVLGALHLCCALVAAALNRVGLSSGLTRPRPEEARAPRSILNLAREAPYLRLLAALVLVVTVSAGMIDFIFKAASAGRFTDRETMLSFFAVFYALTGLVTFLVQALISRKALEKVGLAKTVGALPLSVVAGGAGAIFLPGLLSVALARGAESVFRGSLFRSGYELFYAPIPAPEKRAAKPLLDVGFDRLGDGIAGGVVQMILAFIPLAAYNVILAGAVLLGAVGIWIALQLQQAYVSVLEKNLMSRRERLREQDGDSSLLASVVLTQTSFLPAFEKRTAASETERRRMMAAIAELRSERPERVVQTLAKYQDLDAALVPHVVPLLGSNLVYPEAARLLQASARRHTGQLVDAMLGDQNSETVRRRIPRLLSECHTQRSVDGLLAGLESDSFEVRYRCARALAVIRQAAPKLRVGADAVHEAVRHEASLGRTVWESFAPPDQQEPEGAGELAEALLRNAGSRVLDHIFTLLSLVLPREPLRVAFYGLHSGDAHLRGTALEYLEGVLPEDIRDKLWPYLEDESDKNRPRMSPDQALRELLQLRPTDITGTQ